MTKEEAATASIVENLTLFHNELMSKVFDRNIPATEYLLRTILGRKDIRVKSVKGEYNMRSPVMGGRDITLDILAEEENGREFDVEVQNDPEGAHVRRARFHSSMTDSRMLKKKQDFRELKDSYVIFIYSRDKYHKGLPLYHIDRCVKETGKDFGDGSHIIYVNGRYEGDDEIGRLIHDFKSKRSSDIFNKELANGLKQYKETEEGRSEMSDIVSNIYKEYGKEKEKQGEKRGEKRGEMKTRVNAVQSLMETMKLSADQALDALKIQGKERESIIKAVQG